MNEIIKEYKAIDADGIKIYLETEDLYNNYLFVKKRFKEYKGSMIWKKSGAKEYLFRLKGRRGYGKSLGAKSPETIKIYNSFHNNKKEINNTYKSLKEKLKTKARLCKAIGLGRVPNIVTSILRILEEEGFLESSFIIIGSNSLYAYEQMAGIHFKDSITATQDVDLLWDVRSLLSIHLPNFTDKKNLLNIIQKADRSFRSIRSFGFRAVNKDGYMVDLIKPIPRPPWKKERKSLGLRNDLVAAHIRNIEWLIASPKVSKTVIGVDGYPARIVVPDPRSFALHKLWLSKQDDRDNLKKKRDYMQAILVANLVIKYLPQYQFKQAELKMFPKNIIEKILKELKNEGMPIDFS
ncbi:MAG: nucleotidyltransferase domain-containing protein [Pseudomonadota bacterium]